jgi:hypothetical protein
VLFQPLPGEANVAGVQPAAVDRRDVMELHRRVELESVREQVRGYLPTAGGVAHDVEVLGLVVRPNAGLDQLAHRRIKNGVHG